MVENTNRPSRRHFLRTVAAGTVAAATSGCLSTLPPLGQQVRYGNVDVPPARDPEYNRWIPAESETPDTLDLDIPLYVTPDSIGRSELGTVPSLASVPVSDMDYVGSKYEEFEYVLDNGVATIGKPNVRGETIREAFDQTTYERTEDYGDFSIYAREDVPRAIGVGDKTVVFGSGDTVSVARSKVEVSIDTVAGRIPRREQSDNDFATLSARTGARPLTIYGFLTPSERITENTIGSSMSYTYDETSGYFVYEILYPEDKTPTVDEIKRGLEETRRARESYFTDVTIEDPFVTVAFQIPESEFEPPERNPEAPVITWGVEFDTGAGTVTVRHEAGESVDYGRLGLEPTDSLTGSDPFRDRTGRFGPGDEITFRPTNEEETYRIHFEQSETAMQSIFEIPSLNDGGTDGGA